MTIRLYFKMWRDTAAYQSWATTDYRLHCGFVTDASRFSAQRNISHLTVNYICANLHCDLSSVLNRLPFNMQEYFTCSHSTIQIALDHLWSVSFPEFIVPRKDKELKVKIMQT